MRKVSLVFFVLLGLAMPAYSDDNEEACRLMADAAAEEASGDCAKKAEKECENSANKPKCKNDSQAKCQKEVWQKEFKDCMESK